MSPRLLCAILTTGGWPLTCWQLGQARTSLQDCCVPSWQPPPQKKTWYAGVCVKDDQRRPEKTSMKKFILFNLHYWGARPCFIDPDSLGQDSLQLLFLPGTSWPDNLGTTFFSTSSLPLSLSWKQTTWEYQVFFWEGWPLACWQLGQARTCLQDCCVPSWQPPPPKKTWYGGVCV